MRLLTRYVLRQLFAPFCFALAALTGFMLLNQVARRFGSLVGKGLAWPVIAEVFALSIPFIVAMTLPMAVLVAVLHTFTRLGADNEVTAMRAGGVSVAQLLAPVLAWGAVMAAVNFLFVDQVLPRSNARLRNLLMDINRKKPTFALREQVINEIPPSQYFLRALRIEPGSGQLRGVTIYDVGGQTTRRVIQADSGIMGYAPGGTDLSLKLFHGTIYQLRAEEAEGFQLSSFAVNEIRVRNVFDELQRSTDELTRSDREMSTCEMLAVIDSARRDAREAAAERRRLARLDLRLLLGLPAVRTAARPDTVLRLPRYCDWLTRMGAALLPGTAEAQDSTQRGPPPPATPPSPVLAAPIKAQEPAPPLAGAVSTWSEVQAASDRQRQARRRADRFSVEVQKKYAISAACLPFVLVGIAMALRFPRGGAGVVLGGGFLVFSIYYVGLTAGESLADRGHIAPTLAMWLPNLVLAAIGTVAFLRVNRESGSTRGGDLQEVADWFKALARRRRRPA